MSNSTNCSSESLYILFSIIIYIQLFIGQKSPVR
nr:MAG TPA: hypothetical protein [Bacteriophage sp.]